MPLVLASHAPHRRADFIDDWARLRTALWPDASAAEHRREIAEQLAEPARYAAFIATAEPAGAIGLAEIALRHDYVNGTDSSPVAFLEGIYVAPEARRGGAARLLVEACRAWALAQGCRELASDTALDNGVSQAVHEALGFEETERVVFYRLRLAPHRPD
ncbi:MAG: GNAT family N-acetyltransferase [Bordetella sp.]|nr:GNAT family N-acetyltransferase [Bordetella sp.]